jgi:5'(3')-deoxyribonucleotidase
MDGVIADFVSGAREWVGLDSDHFDPYPSDEQFTAEILDATGYQTMRPFWESLQPEFWRTLPPIESGLDLLSELYDKHRENLFICTTAVDGRSVAGKWAWLINWFPFVVSHGLEHVIFIGRKELLARPGDILIDDRDHILEKWANARGIPLLFREKNIEHILEVCNDR